MDRDDWIYLGAASLIGGGAALYSLPAGLIVFGAMYALPMFVLVILANRKGPDK